MTTSVLHILGIDDTNTVTVRRLSPELTTRDLSFLGNVELLNLIQHPSLEIKTIVCGGMEGSELQVPIPDVVVSAICDADTNRRALDVAEKIVTSLGVPVINHPAAVRETTRERVASLLSLNFPELVIPKTVRFTPRRRADVIGLVEAGHLRTPFLIRPAGDHGGHELGLVPSLDEIDVLDEYALNGKHFYATEFHDFRSPHDGYYRKMRVIVVGTRPYPRHRLINDRWNIHAEDRGRLMDARPDLHNEEAAFLTGFDPADWAIFGKLGAVLGLDYYCVDFAIDADDRIVIFEVNSCARALGRNSRDDTPEHAKAVGDIKQALVELIHNRAVGAA